MVALRTGGQAARTVGFAAAAWAFAVNMLGTTLPTPLYGLYRREFGLSELTVTVVYATYAGGVLAALLLFGRASDQIGRRRALLPALALSAASALVFLAARGVGALYLGRALSGLSAGIITGAGTAAVVDLAAPDRKDRATLIATVVNMLGLGTGPLLAGTLAQFAPGPLRLSYVVDLGLLVLAAAGVWIMPEPVDTQGWSFHPQRPRLPDQVRGVFVRAAPAAAAGFAVLGLFTAVAPAFLAEVLHLPDQVVLGVVVFAVFAASTIGQTASAGTPAHAGLLGGCIALIAGVLVLACGLLTASFALVLIGGVVAGCGQGSAFRAGLAAVNAAAPEEQRAEVASAYFVVAYLAISVPVIGVGALAELTDLTTAGVVFTAAVAATALAVVAMETAAERRPATAG